MLPPNSIFRCMPRAVHVSLRRLMGGLAYAFDGAELYYESLKRGARSFYVPGQTKTQREESWTAEQRLNVVMDAWACLDNLNRCRQIVTRFPYGDSRPEFVDSFLAAMDDVRLLRNRIQHLDEDYQTGANFDLGHPVFGTVSWMDMRFPKGFLQFAIASGPSVEGGLTHSFTFKRTSDSDDVTDFSLMAFDRKISLHERMQAARSFMLAFDKLVTKTIVEGLRDTAISRAIPLERLGRTNVCDMISAWAFRSDGDQWTVVQQECSAKVEVPLGNLNLNAEAAKD